VKNTHVVRDSANVWNLRNTVYCIAVVLPGATRAGPKDRPAVAIVNSPVCARTGLPLTTDNSECVTKMRHEKRNKITSQIAVARVCKDLWSWSLDTRSSSVFDVFCWSPFWKWARIDRVRCCRRRNRRPESANLPWSWAHGQTAYALFYRHEGIMISTLFASSKFVTNRNHFQVIAETGPTGQLHYDGMSNGGHLIRPEDKHGLDFSEPAVLFYAQESTTWMTWNTTITFHRIPARWFMCPLISTSLWMSSALRASARSLGSLIGYWSHQCMWRWLGWQVNTHKVSLGGYRTQCGA